MSDHPHGDGVVLRDMQTRRHQRILSAAQHADGSASWHGPGIGFATHPQSWLKVWAQAKPRSDVSDPDVVMHAADASALVLLDLACFEQ